MIARLIEVPAHALYRCWTEVPLLEQWFAPKPLTTEVLELDLRVGGANRLVMRDADGRAYPAAGVYLEIVPNRRLVFTDAFERAWAPSAKAMMAATISFDEQGDGQTLYTARARHWTVEDTRAHAEMGFHAGWGICAAQLAEVAEGL